MANIKTKNDKIETDGATINLNAIDSSGNFVPDIIWPAGTKKKNKTEKIKDGSDLDFNSIVRQNSSNKSISDFMEMTGYFETEQ